MTDHVTPFPPRPHFQPPPPLSFEWELDVPAMLGKGVSTERISHLEDGACKAKPCPPTRKVGEENWEMDITINLSEICHFHLL